MTTPQNKNLITRVRIDNRKPRIDISPWIIILASGVSAYSPVRNALWAWSGEKVSTKSFWTFSWNTRVHSVFSLLGPLVIVEIYRFNF